MSCRSGIAPAKVTRRGIRLQCRTLALERSRNTPVKVILKYLSKQLLVSMVAVAGVLLLIFMSGRFIKYLADAASGQISADVLFSIMGYRMPGFLELILPLGLFIGILLAYGRMYMESEMTVLQACGMSKWQLVGLTQVTAVLVMFIVAGMSLYLSPMGWKKVESILEEQSRLTEFEMLVPGRFQSLRSGERVTYTEELSDDKKELHHVFIAELDPEQDKMAVVVAQRGTQVVDPGTGSRFIVLHDGRRYDGTPGQPDYRVIEFDSYGLKISELSESVRMGRPDGLSTLELLESEDPKHRALLHWRISLPLLVPVVALLAIPLSRVNPRQGRFLKLLPAMLIYVLYLGLLIVARKALERQQIPEWLGMWWIHLLFLGVALLMLFGGDWLQARRAARATT